MIEQNGLGDAGRYLNEGRACHKMSPMSYGNKIVSYRIAALRANAGRATALAAAVGEAYRKKAPASDFQGVQETIGRVLEEQAGMMEKLHQEHHHWRARERHDRSQLRDAAVALRRQLREVRSLLDQVFGVRRGLANFPGRDDLSRLPMHSLEKVAAGLLRLLEDESFGWSHRGFAGEARQVGANLASRLGAFRSAGEKLAESRAERARAAAEREKKVAEGEDQAAGMTKLLRGLCAGAGYENAAKSLSPRLPRRRRKKAD